MIIKQDSVVSGFRRLAAMFSAFLWDTVCVCVPSWQQNGLFMWERQGLQMAMQSWYRWIIRPTPPLFPKEGRQRLPITARAARPLLFQLNSPKLLCRLCPLILGELTELKVVLRGGGKLSVDPKYHLEAFVSFQSCVRFCCVLLQLWVWWEMRKGFEIYLWSGGRNPFL